MPETIVVPLDGSPLAARAFAVARPLAERLGAEVVLLGCAWDANREDTEAYLENFRREHAAPGLAIATRVIEDQPPAAAILEAVAERPDATVCMTTHGRGRLRWALVGSVAEDVIHGVDAPLLLVGPRGEPRWDEPARRVVVCVDGSEGGAAVVDTACAWAELLALDLHIVFVCHPLDVVDAVHPEVLLEPLVARAREAGVVADVETLRSTYVAGSLVDVMESPPATLAVMATHGRSGVARAALGSVTMGVVNVAPCPVVVAPPHRVATPPAS